MRINRQYSQANPWLRRDTEAVALILYLQTLMIMLGVVSGRKESIGQAYWKISSPYLVLLSVCQLIPWSCVPKKDVKCRSPLCPFDAIEGNDGCCQHASVLGKTMTTLTWYVRWCRLAHINCINQHPSQTQTKHNWDQLEQYDEAKLPHRNASTNQIRPWACRQTRSRHREQL
jgi:hypothetical protein